LGEGSGRRGEKTVVGIFQELKMIQEAPHLLRLKDFERGRAAANVTRRRMN